MEMLLKKLAYKKRRVEIQKRYYETEKGREKVKRNSERRRLKTKYNRVMRQLLMLTTLRRIGMPLAFNYILKR